jgi:uncharacterized membrane protein
VAVGSNLKIIHLVLFYNNMMTESKSPARLEAFSDGVFAIAITLLILEIKVPPVDSIHSVNDLVNALVHLWPSYFAFFYSFGGILIQWILHHNTFNHLNKISRPFLYTNGFLLFSIVFFPFPTALLAEYINTEFAMPAIVFYSMASVVNSLAWFLFIRSINKPKRLLNDAFSPEEYNKLKTGNYLALIICPSTALLAIWFPYTALIISVALWVLWIYLSLVEKE